MYTFYYKIFGLDLPNEFEIIQIDDYVARQPRIIHFGDAVARKWKKHFSCVTVHTTDADNNVNLQEPIRLDAFADSYPKLFGSPKTPLVVKFNCKFYQSVIF